jgi:hypothetical protein
MNQEFKREPGNVAISALGFEVSVSGGMEVAVEYKESGKVTPIPAERTMSGGIGLFMEWAKFPEGTGLDEKRAIFERVVRALWFLDIPISSTEIDPDQKTWPLPQRPK